MATFLCTLWFFTYFASLADPYANNNESEDLEAGFKWERQTPAVVTAVDEYTDLVRVASMMCALRQFHSQDQVSILVFVVGPDSAFANELNAHASNQQFTIVKKFTSATAKQHLSRRDVPAVDAKPVVIAEAILTHELVLWLNPGTYVSKPLSAIFNFLSIHGVFLPKSARPVSLHNRTVSTVGVSTVGFRHSSPWVQQLLHPWGECAMLRYACLHRAVVPADMAHHQHKLSETALTLLFREKTEESSAMEKHNQRDTVLAEKVLKAGRLHVRLPDRALPGPCRPHDVPLSGDALLPAEAMPAGAESEYTHHNEPTQSSTLLFYVGILSAPKNRNKRAAIRKKCVPMWRELVQKKRMIVEFVVGRPNEVAAPRDKFQGFFSVAEQRQAKMLWAERERHGDIHMMTARDTYNDLPTKTLQVFKRGVMLGAKFIVKMDDDMCIFVDKFLASVQARRDPTFAYISNHFWRKMVYPAQQMGINRDFVPYMSGPIYALTFPLAKLIAFDDNDHSALYPMYGSSSEDADMGRWVRYARKRHNITVAYIVKRIGTNIKRIGVKKNQKNKLT